LSWHHEERRKGGSSRVAVATIQAVAVKAAAMVRALATKHPLMTVVTVAEQPAVAEAAAVTGIRPEIMGNTSSRDNEG
jgi:hypothetical protein